MPKRPNPLFEIPRPAAFTEPVLDLLGGVARPRSLSGEEAIAQLARIEAAAHQGDPEAQAELARRLLTESPNARTNRRALILLRKSAAQRSPAGLHLLALLNLRGQGMKKDPTEGVRLLEEAAYLGSAAAQTDLAKALALGIGTAKDEGKALYWLRLAAAQGDNASALSAGRMYRDGLGTLQNEREAQKWLEQAARAGIPAAQFELAELLRRRDISLRDIPGARRWMREAAFSGIVEAQLRIGIASWSGAGGAVDQREAVRWLCRAAEGGSIKAASMLAGFLMTGNGLPLSLPRAWTLFRWAAERGDAGAESTARIIENQISQAERAEGEKLLKDLSPKAMLETLIPRSDR